MTNERAFWEQILHTLNPQWNISIPKGNDPGSPDIAQLTVHIYLVDTSNDWVLSGSVREADAQSARRQTTASPEMARQLVGSIGYLLAECSDAGIDGNSAKAEQAVSASLLALSFSRTFERVLAQTGAASGHWLYLLYHLHDGAMLARPGFIAAKEPRLFGVDGLDRAVRQIVALDVASAGSVGTQIRQGGGLRLSPGLRRALDAN